MNAAQVAADRLTAAEKTAMVPIAEQRLRVDNVTDENDKRYQFYTAIGGTKTLAQILEG